MDVHAYVFVIHTRSHPRYVNGQRKGMQNTTALIGLQLDMTNTLSRHSAIHLKCGVMSRKKPAFGDSGRVEFCNCKH